jgi:hypothetical protein
LTEQTSENHEKGKVDPGGGGGGEREREREEGTSKYKKVHCDIWHMRNLSVYSVWQTSVNFP